VRLSKRRGLDALPAPQSETSVVEREIRVEAEPEAVFQFFTDPEKMVRWMGVGATLDPRPGGVFSFHTLPHFLIEGEYVAVEPYSRIVFTWGYGSFPDDQGNPLPPGSSTVEVALVPDGEATIVHLTHRIPAELADFHSMGWEHYLARLMIAAAGRDPGPDPFLEFLELMSAGNT
jgi:uncharacterized protein YndB with AHSA1/START domain